MENFPPFEIRERVRSSDVRVVCLGRYAKAAKKFAECDGVRVIDASEVEPPSVVVLHPEDEESVSECESIAERFPEKREVFAMMKDCNDEKRMENAVYAEKPDELLVLIAEKTDGRNLTLLSLLEILRGKRVEVFEGSGAASGAAGEALKKSKERVDPFSVTECVALFEAGKNYPFSEIAESLETLSQSFPNAEILFCVKERCSMENDSVNLFIIAATPKRRVIRLTDIRSLREKL